LVLTCDDQLFHEPPDPAKQGETVLFEREKPVVDEIRTH